MENKELLTDKEKAISFKREWIKEHALSIASAVIAVVILIIVPIILSKPVFIGLAPVAGVILYGYLHNKMMIYVEDNLYGEI